MVPFRANIYEGLEKHIHKLRGPSHFDACGASEADDLLVVTGLKCNGSPAMLGIKDNCEINLPQERLQFAASNTDALPGGRHGSPGGELLNDPERGERSELPNPRRD